MSGKNALPYYKKFPRDLIEGTAGLPFEAKVTYNFILDLIYLHGGNLPDDPRYIAGQLNVSVRKWNSLRKAIIDFGKIQVTGEFLTNYRAITELESLSKFQDKQSENRSTPNKNKGLASSLVTPKNDQPEPEPEPEDSDSKNGSESPPPEDDRQAFLRWFIEQRSEHFPDEVRFPIAATIKTQAGQYLKSGMSMAELQEVIGRGFSWSAKKGHTAPQTLGPYLRWLDEAIAKRESLDGKADSARNRNQEVIENAKRIKAQYGGAQTHG